MTRLRCAILDDYFNVALNVADWAKIGDRVDVTVFNHHFPTEAAALKCLSLAIRSLDPTGKGRKRWTNRWKAALNAFDITFDGRLTAGRK